MDKSSAPESAAAQQQEFVTFTLAGEEYGVNIERVLEFIGYRPLTRIPNVPDFIQGMLNLRGSVVPVFDLRQKFGMPPKKYDKYTVIIITEIGSRIMGAIVDAVSDVVTLSSADIQDAPTLSSSIRTDFIRGMASRDDKFLILLDIERIFSQEELGQVGDTL